MARTNAGARSNASGQQITSSPPPRRVRITRSASREPQDSSNTGRENTSLPNKRQTIKRGKERLEPLREDATPPPNASEQQHDAHRDEHVGLGRASIVSGTSGLTAITSFSKEEVSELDRDVVVDVLVDLAQASEKLADFLVPRDSEKRSIDWDEIRTPDAKLHKKFVNRVGPVLLHKQSFGTTDYIQPNIILRALFDVATIHNVPTGPWRPDDVLYKINLVEMLRELIPLNATTTTEEAHDILARLDTSFASTIAGPVFDRKAFKLAIRISTHLFITSLAINKNPESMSILAEIFSHPVRANEYKQAEALHIDSATPGEQDQCQELYAEALQSVMAVIGEEGEVPVGEAISKLNEEYPWDNFLQDMVTYFLSRDARLNAQIAGAGGVEAIAEGLAGVVEQFQNDRAAQALREKLRKTNSKKSFTRNAIAALKAREKRGSDSFRASDSAMAADEIIEKRQEFNDKRATNNLGLNEMESDVQEADASTAQQRARSSLDQLSSFQKFQQENARKARQRAFIDRQTNAQRVEWAENELLQQTQEAIAVRASSSRNAKARRSPAKRTHAEIYEDDVQDFDPTQDEGFETDQRGNTAADQRRREMGALTQTSRSRDLASNGQSSRPSSNLLSSYRPAFEESVRRNPGSAIPKNLPPLDPNDLREMTQDEEYRLAEIKAKQRKAADSKDKFPQLREMFTYDEEAAIRELIAECGPSWAAIKAVDDARLDGPRLRRRTAEQIRQKARNMVFNYLKGDVALPPNFDRVPIDKKLIDSLRRSGIDYDRPRFRE